MGEKNVLGKRRLRVKEPHHNLRHYRAEFDGVRSNIVDWRPYAHFELNDKNGEDHKEGIVDVE